MQVSLCLATLYLDGLPPEGVRTVFQLVSAHGGELVWVDGLDPCEPFLLRASDLVDISFLGDAAEFFSSNVGYVAQLAVIGDFSGVSQLVLARAVLSMQKGALERVVLDEAISLSQGLLRAGERLGSLCRER